MALAEAGGVMNFRLCNVVVTENPTTEIVPEEHAGAIACTIEFLGVDHVGITYIAESIEVRMPADPTF